MKRVETLPPELELEPEPEVEIWSKPKRLQPKSPVEGWNRSRQKSPETEFGRDVKLPQARSACNRRPRRRCRRRSANKADDSRIACHAACAAKCAERARANRRQSDRGPTIARKLPPTWHPLETVAPRSEQPRSEQRTFSRPERAPLPSITELLKEGQEIIVQIAKEPLGQKGARITSHIALPGRYVVYMPTLEHTGVSRKIASDEERLRLKRILQIHAAGIPGGFIVRTAGEGKSEEDLAADMNFLFNLWLDIRQKAEKRPAPLLLHHDLDIVQRTLRDQFTEDFQSHLGGQRRAV